MLEEISTFNSFTSTLRAGDRIKRLRMSFPTVSLFDTLGVQPILGHLPTPEGVGGDGGGGAFGELPAGAAAFAGRSDGGAAGGVTSFDALI